MIRLLIKVILSSYLLLFVVDSYLFSKEMKQYPKIKGVQVFVLDTQYKDDINVFFKSAKSKGVNTVFFRVFHNQSDRPHLGLNLECPHGVYFKTTETCTVANLLPDIIKAAKAYNIKIFAWMATRSLTYVKSDDKVSKAFSPTGDIINGYGGNIFDENISKSIIKIFTDLAKYDIDGILLQDDFIIKYNEGADKLTVDLFNSETGFTATPSTFFNGIKDFNGRKVFSGYKDTFYIWSLWKHTHLMQLLKDINLSIKKVNPKIMLAANVYYETPKDVDMGLAWYAQSIKGLNTAGADYFAIMGYAEQISIEKKLDSVSTIEFINEIAKKSMQQLKNYDRILFKLQNSPFNKSNDFINHNYARKICEALKKNGEFGIIQVPVNSADDILPECL